MHTIYILGSLRSTEVISFANELRSRLDKNIIVFDDWFSSGPESDDYWKRYNNLRGVEYIDALNGLFACNTFDFDMSHLNNAIAVIAIFPIGVSAALEIGYSIGKGKLAIGILSENGTASKDGRWDVMVKLIPHILPHNSFDEVVRLINEKVKSLNG